MHDGATLYPRIATLNAYGAVEEINMVGCTEPQASMIQVLVPAPFPNLALRPPTTSLPANISRAHDAGSSGASHQARRRPLPRRIYTMIYPRIRVLILQYGTNGISPKSSRKYPAW